MEADGARGPAELLTGTVVEIDIGHEALWIAADDGKHQREVVTGGANDRFRAAADTDPGFQRAAFERGKHPLITQGRARMTAPSNLVITDQRGEQIELFLEQDFVL